ncbi:AAL035Wp [Eremothecium gossypii ATCC 10895]|uniref:AAL035Wp n=1 Tax=Eremothecium gossypii (strain ATCC 10895 / CBS 109.51 / FGSC 9923 / NRRL Y-1056) TaxID=284811 RepID=Q75EW3_EREGS|nr:AAL035Wp [Eremothecium gossypii ATCC 10895]AAS50331.1 AAL035Wp [Eremothecium gossypii ATCC 10895]AEY94617.1 FAAL035Wp [Eremothecium gossypii FDAG1]
MLSAIASARQRIGSLAQGPVFGRSIAAVRHKGHLPPFGAKVSRPKTKEELQKERLEAALRSPNKLVRWGAYFQTEEFNKAMTKYLFAVYGLFLIYGIYYMKKLYTKEKERDALEEKAADGHINEYESLRLKQLQGKLRTRDERKLELYNALKDKHPDWDSEDYDGVEFEVEDLNKINRHILPARDTTEFYDEKAEEYDRSVRMEEMAIRMGKRRKWLMKHCEGDVLEVASGTGRNIDYLDLSKIDTITFLDASKNMMKIANKKFREKYPHFKQAAFVVGKAEDLVDLATGHSPQQQNLELVNSPEQVIPESKPKVKYDTIIEAFGLCSHHDPVRALKNFAKLLKPGGRIVLLEHGRGTYDVVNKILDKRAEHRLETWGCRWNLDIGEILDDSDLEIVTEKRTHLGTTWCIVAKRKGDMPKKEEIGFLEKYIRPSLRSSMPPADDKPRESTKN